MVVTANQATEKGITTPAVQAPSGWHYGAELQAATSGIRYPTANMAAPVKPPLDLQGFERSMQVPL